MFALKIFSILLKAVESVLLVIGMGFVAYFTKELHDEYTDENDDNDIYDTGGLGRYEFFLYTTGVGIGIAVLGFVGAITGLLEKKHGALAMFAVQAIWAFQLLVSTALLAKVLTTYQTEKIISSVTFCKAWDKTENRKYHYKCSQLTAGVVGGFGAMAAFGLDAIISLVSHIKSSQYSSL